MDKYILSVNIVIVVRFTHLLRKHLKHTLRIQENNTKKKTFLSTPSALTSVRCENRLLFELIVVRFQCITALNRTNNICLSSLVLSDNVCHRSWSQLSIDDTVMPAFISKYIDTDKNRLAYSMIHAFLKCSTIPTAQFKFYLEILHAFVPKLSKSRRLLKYNETPAIRHYIIIANNKDAYLHKKYDQSYPLWSFLYWFCLFNVDESGNADHAWAIKTKEYEY